VQGKVSNASNVVVSEHSCGIMNGIHSFVALQVSEHFADQSHVASQTQNRLLSLDSCNCCGLAALLHPSEAIVSFSSIIIARRSTEHYGPEN
jgi:hypothetical protein